MISLFNKVLWKSKICIVTNVRYGTKIQISPVGNGNAPAKYYIVRPDDLRK